jgi:hypothetical protein
MNARFVKSLIAAGLLALASIAPVAAQSSEMRITVPFAFLVGTQKLSAGEYYVQRAEESGLVLIHSRTGEAATVLALVTGNYNSVNEQPGLVFERNGQGDAVLTKVQLTGQQALLVNGHPLKSEKAVASR